MFEEDNIEELKVKLKEWNRPFQVTVIHRYLRQNRPIEYIAKHNQLTPKETLEVIALLQKFKRCLPEDVSDFQLERAVYHAYERCKSYDISLEELLKESTRITYGTGRHMLFDYTEGNYITIYHEDPLPLSWVFDEDGELIAT